MDETPEFWKLAMRTPDAHKVELSGERFLAGTHRVSQRWRGRRAAKVVVQEPLMKMLDEVMVREGVSDGRVEKLFGLYEKKLKDMRQDEGAWKMVTLVRKMFWAMGYDLEMRVVKKRTPDKALVVTSGDVDMKRVDGEWDKSKMWSWLGMEKL